MRPILRSLGCVSIALALAGCAGGRRAPEVSRPGAQMGLYRTTVERTDGPARRFRLLLYAELPDRIHGEILSPVGTTEAIVDGGDGRVSVSIPGERVAYTGAGDEAALERVLGVGLSLERLVRALLGFEDQLDDHRLSRAPRARTGLPEQLEIEGRGHRLELRLKKLRPLRVSTASLGNGRVPPGFEVRPLELLEVVELPEAADEGRP